MLSPAASNPSLPTYALSVTPFSGVVKWMYEANA